MIAGPGYDRCGVYAAEATAAGLQTVRDHLAAEAIVTATAVPIHSTCALIGATGGSGFPERCDRCRTRATALRARPATSL